jgi:hypothetical protein
VLYIYLATVTNAITFGGLLGDATDGAQVGGAGGGRVEGGEPLQVCYPASCLLLLGVWVD